jgi:putative tricarboxylic transport membrane protein
MPSDRARSRGVVKPALLVGPAFIALSALVFYDSRHIEAGDFYAGVGARAFPDIVSAGLLLIGVGLLIGAMRGTIDIKLIDSEEGMATPLKNFGLVAAGLLLDVVLMKPAGFIPATFLLFFCTAKAFGARGIVRPVLISAILPTAIYFLFGHVIGVQLPQAFPGAPF